MAPRRNQWARSRGAKGGREGRGQVCVLALPLAYKMGTSPVADPTPARIRKTGGGGRGGKKWKLRKVNGCKAGGLCRH